MCIVYSSWNLLRGIEFRTIQCERCSVLQVNECRSHRKTKRVKHYNLYSPLSTRYLIHNFFIYYICFGLLCQTVLCNNSLFNHLKPDREASSSSSSSKSSASSASSSSSSASSASSSSSSSSATSSSARSSVPNRSSSSSSVSLNSRSLPTGGSFGRRSRSERCPINECQPTSKYFDEEDCKGYRTIIKCLGQKHIARPCHGFLIYRTWQSTVTKYMKEKRCSRRGPDYWPRHSQTEQPKRTNLPWTGVPQHCSFQPGRYDGSPVSRYDESPPPVQHPSDSSGGSSTYDNQRIIESSPYVLCALFGRGHLLPYRLPARPPETSVRSTVDDSFSSSSSYPTTSASSQLVQTCSLEGAWPLLDNRYITIQVTALRDPNHSTTTFSQVTVLIKGYVECVPGDYHSYTVFTNRSLPSTLDSGRRVVGQASLRVRTPGKHVDLLLRHIGTMVSLRLLHSPLSRPPVPANDSDWDSSTTVVDGLVGVTVRIPRKLVVRRPGRRPLVPQLCSTGCPVGSHVDERSALSKHPAKKPRQRTVALAYAEEACRAGKLRGEFLDACVFDSALFGAGDGGRKAPVKLAVGVFEDVKQLKPDVALLVANRTLYRPYTERDTHSNASLESTSSIRLLIVCAFLVYSVLLVNR